MNRSFLFVPADSERKLEKARTCGADAIILDLEDSVAASRLPQARHLAAEYLRSRPDAEVWVRINPWGSADADDDLQAVMAAAPDGIVLPKPQSAGDALLLASRLGELEQAHGLDDGRTKILPVATEHPAALFNLDSYTDATSRLAGLTWGAEDLSAAVGASQSRDAAGHWLPPYQLARSLCLFAAAAANVPAIDTVYTDFRNRDGLAESAAAARRDGFAGKLAIHPDQVPVINAAFVPTRAETERAQRIVELFAANPDAGTLAMDGKMIDRPHLKQAQRMLATADLQK